MLKSLKRDVNLSLSVIRKVVLSFGKIIYEVNFNDMMITFYE